MTAEGPVAFCGRCRQVLKDGDAVVRTELRTRDDVWGVGPIYHAACFRGPKANLRELSRDFYSSAEPGGREARPSSAPDLRGGAYPVWPGPAST